MSDEVSGRAIDRELAGIPGPVAQRNGWQPIETAPRDGTVILLFDPRLKGEGGQIMTGCSIWGPDMWQDNAYGDVELTPTHWMPLPPNPA